MEDSTQFSPSRAAAPEEKSYCLLVGFAYNEFRLRLSHMAPVYLESKVKLNKIFRNKCHKQNASHDQALMRDLFRRAASFIPSGVAVVAWCETDGGPCGLTVSTLIPVSVNPPLVSVCIDRDSRSVALLQEAESFSVNLLARDQGELASRFATPCTHRFKDLQWRKAEGGEPILEGVVATMMCELVGHVEAGDHTIVIAEVKKLILREGEPLVYWRRGLHGVHRDYPFIANSQALERFVEEWETGVLPRRCWTHTAHVAIAAYYNFAYPSEEAFQRTKSGIVHYNTCVGTPNTDDSGYHETLTRFWSEVVGDFVRRRQLESQFDAVRYAVDVLGEDRDRHRLYYSFDVVRDRRARREWVPPDRMLLPGSSGERL
jgi:flavin reductase (DIM6/NTAB) family NADH-FMN oxidoreductase RutF